MVGLCLEENMFWQVARQKNICILWIMHSWYTAACSWPVQAALLVGREQKRSKRGRINIAKGIFFLNLA